MNMWILDMKRRKIDKKCTFWSVCKRGYIFFLLLYHARLLFLYIFCLFGQVQMSGASLWRFCSTTRLSLAYSARSADKEDTVC